jgi:hypothetical protein|tara:strand:+ start:185 stop:520 length:336 start_codon:yes stop_codon:yes gene_type:complete
VKGTLRWRHAIVAPRIPTPVPSHRAVLPSSKHRTRPLTHSKHLTKPAGGGGPGVTHEGLTLHEPGAFHKFWAYGLGGLTWFWIFYRFYKDGDTLIYGHAPHFEHDDHDDHH